MKRILHRIKTYLLTHGYHIVTFLFLISAIAYSYLSIKGSIDIITSMNHETLGTYILTTFPFWQTVIFMLGFGCGISASMALILKLDKFLADKLSKN